MPRQLEDEHTGRALIGGPPSEDGENHACSPWFRRRVCTVVQGRWIDIDLQEEIVKSKLEKSREEQLAGDMLALVERFHAPSSHEDRTSRRAGLALPVAL